MNDIDFYAEWLGIPPDRRPPNLYELLGLDACEDDAVRIRSAGLERSAKVRRYSLGQHGAEATRLLGELAAAFACLTDPVSKAAYDRELFGADSGQSAVDIAPPIQSKAEPTDGEAQPCSSNGGGRISYAAARSFLSIRRRRTASAAGPARFSLAACLLMAAVCGAVWSARNLPGRDDLPGSAAARPSIVAIHGEKPPGRTPVARAQKSAPAVSPETLASRAKRPAVNATQEINSAEPISKESGPAEAPSHDDAPEEQTSASANVTTSSSIAENKSTEEPVPGPQPPAEPEDSVRDRGEGTKTTTTSSSVADRRAPPVVQVPGILRKDIAPPFSVAQVTGMADMDFQDPAEDFGKAWRSARRGEPEVLELTFAAPVSPRLLRIFETPLAARVDEIVLHPVNGPPQRIKPIKMDFDAQNHRAQTWGLGASRPAVMEVEITFSPSEEGFVEVDAVALLDQRQNAFYAVAAKATSSAVADDPDILGIGQALPTQQDESDGPDAKSNDSLAKVDEVLAEAQLNWARKQQAVAAYAAVLRDYPNTSAAVEAVRDLAEIIDRASSSEAYSARQALDRLMTRHPDSNAAKQVWEARGAARGRSGSPPSPENRRPSPGMPPRRRG